MVTTSAVSDMLLLQRRDSTSTNVRESLPQKHPWTAKLMVVLLAAGIGERLLRYFLQFPIWGDEAYLCLNFLNQTYLGFFDGMKHNQVAPVLFLWSELTVFHWLGGSELALRLLPLLAGVAALLLFWRLARRVLEPVAAVLAVGIFAVSYYPVRHAVEVKPYSFDLLVSVVLTSLALMWLQKPYRLKYLVGLCLVIGVLLGFSYPAVFVAGGISLALLPPVYRRSRRAKVLWISYNVLLLMAFAGYLIVGNLMNSPHDREIMTRWWRHAFPPSEPIAFVKWFFVTHTSNLMAYPAGGKNGGSTVTFLCFLIGAAACWKQGRKDLLLVCLAPFALTFLAACFERYPYGESARVSQHLAPMICLLTGVGLASIFAAWTRTLETKKKWVTVACLLLVFFGLACSVIDCIKPYKTEMDRKARLIAHSISKNAGPHNPVVILSSRQHVFPEMQWYLKRYHPDVHHHTEVNWSRISSTERIVGIRFSHHAQPSGSPVLPDSRSQRTRKLVKKTTYTRPIDAFADFTEYCEVSHWR